MSLNSPIKKRIEFKSQSEALAAFGQYDNNLKRLEKENNVEIYARGVSVTVKGKEKDVQNTILQLKKLEDADTPNPPNEILRTPTGKPIQPLSSKQRVYVKAMESKDIVVAIGPAGTGKTFLACAHAVKCLKQGKVDRIVLTRPIVEVGEKLGFLPGDFLEKIDPYLRPLYDAFYTIMGAAKFHKYSKDNIIEIVPIAYMRGRTLDDAMIILDEAQNTSSTQMQMFLTRLGFNSKAVITGDITQVDLESHQVSGLIEVQDILKGIDGVEFVYFSKRDVVRHRLVKKIIDAYEKRGRRKLNDRIK